MPDCITILNIQHSWAGPNLQGGVPSEEFELTANTLQAPMKTDGRLILKPLIYHTANSPDDLTL